MLLEVDSKPLNRSIKAINELMHHETPEHRTTRIAVGYVETGNAHPLEREQPHSFIRCNSQIASIGRREYEHPCVVAAVKVDFNLVARTAAGGKNAIAVCECALRASPDGISRHAVQHREPNVDGRGGSGCRRDRRRVGSRNLRVETNNADQRGFITFAMLLEIGRESFDGTIRCIRDFKNRELSRRGIASTPRAGHRQTRFGRRLVWVAPCVSIVSLDDLRPVWSCERQGPVVVAVKTDADTVAEVVSAEKPVSRSLDLRNPTPNEIARLAVENKVGSVARRCRCRARRGRGWKVGGDGRLDPQNAPHRRCATVAVLLKIDSEMIHTVASAVPGLKHGELACRVASTSVTRDVEPWFGRRVGGEIGSVSIETRLKLLAVHCRKTKLPCLGTPKQNRHASKIVRDAE
jgi:hypothetical protein